MTTALLLIDIQNDYFPGGRMELEGNMCVDATTRAASDYGFECLVAGDACATRALQYRDERIPAAHVHGSFLAALHGSYGKVVKWMRSSGN